MPFITFPMIFVAISSFYVLQLGGSLGWIGAAFILAMGVVFDTIISFFFPPYFIIAGIMVLFMIFTIIFIVPWPFLIMAYIGKGTISGVFSGSKDIAKKGYEKISN